jgi:hypothetical protein
MMAVPGARAVALHSDPLHFPVPVLQVQTARDPSAALISGSEKCVEGFKTN